MPAGDYTERVSLNSVLGAPLSSDNPVPVSPVTDPVKDNRSAIDSQNVVTLLAEILQELTAIRLLLSNEIPNADAVGTTEDHPDVP